MLAVSCRFLLGTYQAAAPGRIAEPEWPPHPARLQIALVAAGWALGGERFPAELRAALRWLECQPPPAIHAPAAPSRTPATVYMPRNLTRTEARDARGHLRRGDLNAFSRATGRVARTFPTRVPGDGPVWFTWPEADPDDSIRAALDRALGAIPYLGSSRSPVACAVGDDPPESSLVPVGGVGSTVLRIPFEGFTDRVVASRDRALPPGLHATAAYARPAPRRPRSAAGPFGRLVVLARTRGYALPVQHTVLVTRALRRAALAQAGDRAPEELHGHGRHPHVAFLALPNVGHPHSTGEIHGVAAAIPADAEPDVEGTIIAALDRVAEDGLAVAETIVPWALERLDGEPDRRTLDPARWVGPARVWRTATPIVLDRHPKREETLEDMMRLSFVNALLPVPTKVRVSRYPYIGGAAPARMHTGHGAPEGVYVHADVRFEAPVRGPILVGRGRYMGLGLLAPVGERAA